MPAADVTTEAVRALATDLNRYHEVAMTTTAELEASARAVREHVEGVLRHRRAILQAAQVDLAAARAERARQERMAADAAAEDRPYTPVFVDVERFRLAAEQAERAVERAERTRRTVDQRLEDGAAATRSYLRAAGLQVASAQATLARISRDLDDYRSGSAGGAGGGGHGAGSAGRTSAPASASAAVAMAAGSSRFPTRPGVPDGIRFVPLSEIDDADSAVTGAESFGKGYSVEDLTWAHDALLDVVLPTLASGGTIDDLRRRDAAEGRQGVRSYADTYSGFFSGDAIRLDADLKVENGYHRIWVARRMGLDAVPVRVR